MSKSVELYALEVKAQEKVVLAEFKKLIWAERALARASYERERELAKGEG